MKFKITVVAVCLLVIAQFSNAQQKKAAAKAVLRAVILIFFLVASAGCIAQEIIEENFRPHHQLGLVLSHSHVFEGIDAEGKRSVLSLPAWGFDYSYLFHSKWAIGLHTDLIIEKFKVERNLGNKETIERSYPVAPAIMGIYKANHHWNFLFGMGGEFAKEENFVINRLGIEYAAELHKGWEVFGTFGYDFRWNAYDTWTLGIGIAKSLGKEE